MRRCAHEADLQRLVMSQLLACRSQAHLLIDSGTSLSRSTGQRCPARHVKCVGRSHLPLTPQLGDESLPEEPPSVTRSGDLNEEQLAALQSLHHVLLEVRFRRPAHADAADTRAGRQYDLPIVLACLRDQRRDTEHGASSGRLS